MWSFLEGYVKTSLNSIKAANEFIDPTIDYNTGTYTCVDRDECIEEANKEN